jgi:hypothetical protein
MGAAQAGLARRPVIAAKTLTDHANEVDFPPGPSFGSPHTSVVDRLVGRGPEIAIEIRGWGGLAHQDSDHVLLGSEDQDVPRAGVSLQLGSADQLVRVDSMIQFVSQVCPPSSENACSQRAEVGVIADQT